MDLSIIVVSWNTRERLEHCLASIYDNPPPAEFEVWVVDNASSDDSVAMVRRRFPQVRLIVNAANLGFARANNQALRGSAARFVLLLNSDAALVRGALSIMLTWMDAHPRAGVAGPTLLNPDGSYQASAADFPTLLSQLLTVAGLANRVFGPHFPSHGPAASSAPVRADWMGGACLLARRDAIEEVGLLDEDYFMYAEEMDWCFRMWRAGWEVVHLPEARCLHWGGQSSRQVRVHTNARLAGAAILFFRKHYGGGQALLLRAGVAALGLARTLLFSALYTASLARRPAWRDKAAASWRLAVAGLGGAQPAA